MNALYRRLKISKEGTDWGALRQEALAIEGRVFTADNDPKYYRSEIMMVLKSMCQSTLHSDNTIEEQSLDVDSSARYDTVSSE